MLQRICVAACLLLVLACGSGDLTLDEADPDAVTATPTWDQVYSIFERECAPCHTEGDDDELDEDKAGTGAMKAIAGAEPDLSTCIAIIENLDDAMATIFDKNNMPPGAWPRLTEEERLILQRWMEQGEAAPCK